MPNPTTLTVKVTEGTLDKLSQAIRVALPYCCIDPGDDSASLCIDQPRDGVEEPIALNPNVLDPEDAVLVARVLGAVLACDNGNGGYDPIYTCWHETLGAMVQCDALGNKTGSVNAGLKEWVLHSIPSLGLTR